MKLIALVIAGFIIVNLAACSSNNDQAVIDTTTNSLDTNNNQTSAPIPNTTANPPADNDPAVVDTTTIPVDTDNNQTSAPIPITPVNLPVDDAPLDQNAPFLMNALAGYQLTQIGTDLRKTVAIITSTSATSTALDDQQYVIVDQEQNVVVPTKRINYECGVGGSLTVEQTESAIYDSFYSHETDVVKYIFSDCLFSSNPAVTDTADYQFNGSVTLLDDSLAFNRGSTHQSSEVFDTFSLSVPGNLTIELSGSSLVNMEDSENNNGQRTVMLDYYREVENGTLELSIENSAFSLTDNHAGSESRQTYRNSMEGTVRGSATLQREVVVTTVKELERVLIYPLSLGESTLFQGQLQFAADDGTMLLMNGNPAESPVPETLLYNFELLKPDGTSSATDNARLKALSVHAPEKTFF